MKTIVASLLLLMLSGCATMPHQDTRDKALDVGEGVCAATSMIPLVGVAGCGAALLNQGVWWLITPAEKETGSERP
jgi:hypothetical protein